MIVKRDTSDDATIVSQARAQSTHLIHIVTRREISSQAVRDVVKKMAYSQHGDSKWSANSLSSVLSNVVSLCRFLREPSGESLWSQSAGHLHKMQLFARNVITKIMAINSGGCTCYVFNMRQFWYAARNACTRGRPHLILY